MCLLEEKLFVVIVVVSQVSIPLYYFSANSQSGFDSTTQVIIIIIIISNLLCNWLNPCFIMFYTAFYKTSLMHFAHVGIVLKFFNRY